MWHVPYCSCIAETPDEADDAKLGMFLLLQSSVTATWGRSAFSLANDALEYIPPGFAVAEQSYSKLGKNCFQLSA